MVQFTPPGSQCSVIFGTGLTAAEPGSAQALILVVYDIDEARAELVGRGVDVSEVFHDAARSTTTAPRPRAGPGSRAHSYASFASFSDPDGNGWVLQEITTRLPGRWTHMDVAALAELLHETAEHHGPFEKASPPHDWWDWYAAYMAARQHGAPPRRPSAGRRPLHGGARLLALNDSHIAIAAERIAGDAPD